MEKLIIIPDNDKELNNKYPEQIRLSYTYLHGKLEEDCRYDLYNIAKENSFGFKEKDGIVEPDKEMTGLYPCLYKDKDCTLFLWVVNNMFRGLVVYNDDVEGYKFAMDKYMKKEKTI
jgi:hypothetical protein